MRIILWVVLYLFFLFLLYSFILILKWQFWNSSSKFCFANFSNIGGKNVVPLSLRRVLKFSLVIFPDYFQSSSILCKMNTFVLFQVDISLPQVVMSSVISERRVRKKRLWSLNCPSAIKKTQKSWSWANQLRIFKINSSTCLVWKLNFLIRVFIKSRIDVLSTVVVLVNAQQSTTVVFFSFTNWEFD